VQFYAVVNTTMIRG